MGRGSFSRACLERVVRRGAPRRGPLLFASAPSSITHVPSPFALISTLVVAGTTFAYGFDTVQLSAPSEALWAGKPLCLIRIPPFPKTWLM